MYGKICESYVARAHETVVFVLNLRVSTRYTGVEFKVLIELLEMPFVKGQRRLHLAKQAL